MISAALSPRIEAFNCCFEPHAKEIMADIPNYTDLSPVIQVSEVVVGSILRSGKVQKSESGRPETLRRQSDCD